MTSGNESAEASPNALTLLTSLKERHYRLERFDGLLGAFNNTLDHFMSSRQAGVHFEGRGVLLTGSTRSGKTHAVKHLLRDFAAQGDPLPAGYARNYVRVSLRTAATWKQFGCAYLKALGYPADLDHRSVDLVMRRVESTSEKKNCFVLHVDECQHMLAGKPMKEVNAILDGLKDLMKRPDWPIVPIFSGVPELIDLMNQSPQLTALLEPVRFPDMANDADTLAEVDKILVRYGELAKIDPSPVRNEDSYNRMIHAAARQWGRLFELIIHTVAETSSAGKQELAISDFARTFARWTGAPDSGNVFYVASPYRIKTDQIYRH